jgi:beta-mannosidase
VSSFLYPISVAQLENKLVQKIAIKDLLNGRDKQTTCAIFGIYVTHEKLTENVLFFSHPKDLKLQDPGLTYTIKDTAGGYVLTLRSSYLAKDLFIDLQAECSFSDNYFDLLPGTEKKVFIKTSIDKKQLSEKLRLHSLHSTY